MASNPAIATAYIGLGSNLENPALQLETALKNIEAIPGTSVVAVSRHYASKPLGPQDQPDYLNAVAKICTELRPTELLRALQNIELQQGRTRGIRWGARTIDLDILLYANIKMNTPELCIPHKRNEQQKLCALASRRYRSGINPPGRNSSGFAIGKNVIRGYCPASKGRLM
jgi:2-amino-4-hydroxy-6-hydroxymethyldihydropteridine diphosphokinase